MATWYPPEQREGDQRDIDMHAGHETATEPVKDQPGEQIDWDAHKRFMRGL